MITEVGLQVSQPELPQEKRHINQQRKQQIKQPAEQQQIKQKCHQEEACQQKEACNQKQACQLNIAWNQEEVRQQKEAWIICPACHNKTRTRVREDTVLLNFPLYCPKCKQEHLINVKQLHISVITEPDAQMQSR